MSKYPTLPPPYGFHEQPGIAIEPARQQQPPHMVIVGAVPVGPNPQTMTCPSCHHQISTKIETESVTKTHIMALLLFLFCCWPCICVPYCMDSCKNINHYCPKCNSYLGTYKN